MYYYRESVPGNVIKAMLARILGNRTIGWALAVVAAEVVMSSCSGGITPHLQATQKSPASGALPSYSQAARLRPCDSVSTSKLSSIIGKPVHVDKVGDIGQMPILSSGPVLRKVWIATCNWTIQAYPTTVLYLQVELTPSPAGARTDFDGLRAGMRIAQPVVHEAGYGQEVVFSMDNHGDVVVIILQDAEVVSLQFNSTSQPAPSSATRMSMAKAITRLIMERYGTD